LGNGLSIIRPLLDVSRAQVESFCTENNVTPRQDPSNRGTKYVRSRLRQRMPEIAREFNPRLGDALRRLADNARTDRDYIAVAVEDLWEKGVAVKSPGHTLSLFIAILSDAHPALTRRVLLRAIRTVYPDNRPVEREEATSAGFVEALERVVRDRNGAVTLPGKVQARLTNKRVLLTLSYPTEALPELHF
jgi:tRNA(Ile)-lysidine synthase